MSNNLLLGDDSGGGGLSDDGVRDCLVNSGLLVNNKSLLGLDRLDVLGLVELGLELGLGYECVVVGFGFSLVGEGGGDVGDGFNEGDEGEEGGEGEEDAGDDENGGPGVGGDNGVDGEVGVDVSEGDGVGIVVEVGIDVFKE